MATIFSLTITIGKGENARTREISIDPDEVPMGVLEDLEALGESKEWKQIRPIMQQVFDLSNEEFRAMTSKQFIDLARALTASVGAAVTIPNDAN